MSRFRWVNKYEYQYFEVIGERYQCWDAGRLIPIEHAVLFGFSLDDLEGYDVLLLSLAFVSRNIQNALTCIMDEEWRLSRSLDPQVIALDAKVIKIMRKSVKF